MDLHLHKADFIREFFVTKTIRNLLVLYKVKNETLIDLNLCSIKLHELCEFDQRKYLQNNIDFFAYKVEYIQWFSFN